jgi:DNA-binding MarR family transcriptional regulator
MSPMNDRSSGLGLALILLGGFRAMVDALHEELAAEGHPEARPLHGFALQALGAEGATLSELGRRLGVTKQAAAKTVAGLERLGYVERAPHPEDGRATIVRRAPRGEEMLERSREAFDAIRAEWSRRLGAARLTELEGDLQALAGDGRAVSTEDLPGWLR